MKYLFIILILVLVGCENNTKMLNDLGHSSDSDVQEQTDNDGYNLESDDPYVDKKNGLIWAETIYDGFFVNDAITKCKNHVENGYSGYFLPTIEQLETLVKDCSEDERCEEAEDGRYSIFGDSGRFWSSSYEYITDITSLKSPYPVPLYLDFNIGIKGYDPLSEKNLYKVRCAREKLFPGSVRKDQRCVSLPENAKWNTVYRITQTWNGEEWEPTLEAEYNEDPSTEECRYICEEGYVEEDGECVSS